MRSLKTLSVTEVARNFSAVLDAVEGDQEEIVLVRNQRHVARLVPEAPRQDALSVFGDLYRTLDDQTAEAEESPSREKHRLTSGVRLQITETNEGLVLWPIRRARPSAVNSEANRVSEHLLGLIANSTAANSVRRFPPSLRRSE